MGRSKQKLHALTYLLCAILLMIRVADAGSKPTEQTLSASNANLAQLIGAIREKAKSLETSSGMRLSFRSFAAAYKISPQSVSYSDYVVARLLYEASRMRVSGIFIGPSWISRLTPIIFGDSGNGSLTRRQ